MRRRFGFNWQGVKKSRRWFRLLILAEVGISLFRHIPRVILAESMQYDGT